MVVGYHDQRPGVVAKKDFEPTDGQDVQMVGGFVQQQHVRITGQHLGQQDTKLETAG